MNPYDYTPADHGFNLELREDTPRWQRDELSFGPAAGNRRIGGELARGDYYRPRRSTSAPLVIVAHGMGSASRLPAGALARSLVERGWAAYVPYLTAHASRTPQMLTPDTLSLDDWFELYRTSVIELRQALDWAQGRPDIDSHRVAITGISFGGFVASIAMALDERLKAGVLIESGGNALRINQLSPTMRRRYPSPPANYERLQREYQAYLAEVASKGVWRVSPARRHFLTDPLTFASLLRGRPLMMINGRYDALIPRQAAREMSQAAGAESMLWLPAGHLWLWLYYPLISRRIHTFLDRSV